MDPHNPIVQFPPRGPVILESAAVRRRRELVRRWIDRALQAAIVVLTIPGMWFVGGAAAADVRLGAVFLLASQPFWLAATWRARHFGAFTIACLYTGLWLRAILNTL